MSKPKRGNWRVRECAASVQSMIDDYSEHKSGDPALSRALLEQLLKNASR